MGYKIKKLTNEDLFAYFKDVSNQAHITPFIDVQYKKNDTQNVKNLKAYSRAISAYISCIQELRSRGFTLLEIMEILK